MGCVSTKSEKESNLERSTRPEKEIPKAKSIHVESVRYDPNVDINHRRGVPANSGFQSTSGINYNVKPPKKYPPNTVVPSSSSAFNPVISAPKVERVWWEE